MRVLLSGAFFFLGWIDPGCAWQVWRGGWLADEALGVGEVGAVQDVGAPGPDGCRLAVVDVGAAHLTIMPRDGGLVSECHRHFTSPPSGSATATRSERS